MKLNEMPRVGSDAPTNPDRATTREQWKAAESVRRWRVTIDKAFAGLMEDRVLGPIVKGPRDSARLYTEGDRKGVKVPEKRWVKLDLNPGPKGPETNAPEPDVAIPTRPGETGRQALARIRTIIGKKISDIPELATIWDGVEKWILNKHALTQENMPTLYDNAQQLFWDRVAGKTPQGLAARKALAAAGLETTVGKGRAALLEGTDPRLRVEEIRVSLDHIKEKGQGQNWRLALDPTNLRLEMQLPNTERENSQQRHPELRPPLSNP